MIQDFLSSKLSSSFIKIYYSVFHKLIISDKSAFKDKDFQDETTCFSN